ncbi:hypothetical protein K2173_000872 [Erythroxylum novogranatense]|uniref:NAC domain-containing protein n=1 Tax=Erythroxylum novogranatense TaxID=1862640 RepID=A0AAV8TQD8_9ROSI|nr:hypothetical protein K2173_000872 [Erythroxylum novogranatense]
MVLPGFRFCPTDEELVMYYLKKKVLEPDCPLLKAIGEICIYRYAPWDLPKDKSPTGGDLKWYFFCPIEKKYARSARMNRSTDLGYWKTSGRDRMVHHKSVVVGTIRTLIFHKGKPPNGERRDWVMHEYKLEGKEWAEKGIAQDREEDWYIEEEEELGDGALFSSTGVSTWALPAQDNPITSHVLFNYAPENMTWPPVHETVVPDTNASTEASQIAPVNGDIL